MENTSYTPGQPGGGTMQSTMEQAKEQAKQVAEQTGEKAGQMMDQAREQVKSQLDSQKERAAGELDAVAQALHQTGEQLRQEQHDMAGRYADSVAGMVEQFAGYLHGHRIEELFGEVENFARRQPAVFLGGAFALGFLAARFLKSSSQGGGGSTRGGRGETWRSGTEYGGAGYGAGYGVASGYQPGETATGMPPATMRAVESEPQPAPGWSPEAAAGETARAGAYGTYEPAAGATPPSMAEETDESVDTTGVTITHRR